MSILQASRSAWTGRLLSLLRIVAGYMFFLHGAMKLFHWPPADPPLPNFPLGSMPGIAGLLEVIGGILIILGLFTRPVAFILAGEMAVAYFMSHAPRGPLLPVINGGEPAVLYCFIFLYMSLAGGGSWSVDHLIASNRFDQSQRH